MAADRLAVSVAVATPQRQEVFALDVPAGTTVRQAIERARVFEEFPELSPAQCAFGIYGRLCAADTLVYDGDRVEVYRPLADDPKAIRKRRAAAG